MILRDPLGKAGGAGGKYEHGCIFVVYLGKRFFLG
jgi:hypothetical protein